MQMLHLPYIDTSYMYPFGYALRIPNRVIKKYNRRTKSFYFVEDKISKSFQLTDFSTLDTASMQHDYYSRIEKYNSRFPSRSRGVRNNSVIPILWYDDIRKFDQTDLATAKSRVVDQLNQQKKECLQHYQKLYCQEQNKD